MGKMSDKERIRKCSRTRLNTPNDDWKNQDKKYSGICRQRNHSHSLIEHAIITPHLFL